ncbi:MAG: immune inhibitor A [Anaerolineae bacterium]|nr:immune inhibitor A [Anaerolineae bacterium]
MSNSRRSLWLLLALVALLIGCAALCVCGSAATLFIVSSRSSAPEPTVTARPIATATATEIPPVTAMPLPTATARPSLTPPSTPTASGGQTPTATSPPPAAAADTVALLKRVEVPPRDLRDLAQRLRPEAGPIPKVVRETPKAYRLGDTEVFWVSDQDNNRHFQITAELRYVTDHLYIWVQQGEEVNQRDLERSALRFEQETYPRNREFFGSEWTLGVDGDPHLFILHAKGIGASIAGYYSSADEYSRLANPYSNEKEMFYVSLDGLEPNTTFYDSVLAHEFQHMIHWYQDRNEDTWVNEGMSELAAQINGYDLGGTAFMFTRSPETQLTTWTDSPQGNAAHYAGAYLFMSYFLERFGETTTRAVIASPLNGAAGFDDALAAGGHPERFDDVFADWVVANLLDDVRLLAGRFGYKDIDLRRVLPSTTFRTYPVQREGELPPYATEYVTLAGAGDVTIVFTGTTTTRLVATGAHSGRYAFWGNRADDSDAHLTRRFDLSNASSATLTAWVWYSLEDGFDYAYAQVSADGGTTWTILPGRFTTTRNPVGNAFGPGLTGTSGRGGEPAWVQEEYDLTPFAGRQVLVRFEYVTDDAVNYPGILIDDVSVPEIGYHEDFEAGGGDWQAVGFLRTDNRLPQRWLVQVVERSGRQAQVVRRLDVGADGLGTWTVAGLDGGRDAVLIISALAPATTETATYAYQVRRAGG